MVARIDKPAQPHANHQGPDRGRWHQPGRVGPAEFSAFAGGLIAVRCPSELAPLIRAAGGEWEPGGRRWLVRRRRLGPLIRKLRRETDLLFRHAGIDLDEARGMP